MNILEIEGLTIAVQVDDDERKMLSPAKITSQIADTIHEATGGKVTIWFPEGSYQAEYVEAQAE